MSASRALWRIRGGSGLDSLSSFSSFSFPFFGGLGRKRNGEPYYARLCRAVDKEKLVM